MQKISVAILNDIIRYLDNDLIEFYTDNYQKNKYLKESLFDYVSYYVQTDILDKDPEGLSKLLTLKMRARTRRKTRYLQKCKDDVDLCIWEHTDNLEKFFARNKVYSYTALNAEQRATIYVNQTLDDIIAESLKLVEIWSKDAKSKMIKCPGTEYITDKTKCSYFENDLLINILQVIKERYHSDLSSQTMTYLDYLGDKSILSASSTEFPLNETGVTQIEIRDPINSNIKTVITYDGTSAAKYYTLLDTLDVNIISYITNKSIQTISDSRSILIPESDLVKAVLLKNGTNRILSQRDRERVRDHIYKLQHTRLDVYQNDTIIASYGLLGDTKFSQINGINYIESFSNQYITKQVEDGLITRLPTYAVDRLDDNTAQLLYLPLMQQRYKIYRLIRNKEYSSSNDYTVIFKRIDFSRFLNFSNCTVTREKEMIENALQDYVNKNLFIKEFKYSRVQDEYKIIFYELSEEEIADIEYTFYNQDPAKISNMIVGNVLSPSIVDAAAASAIETTFADTDLIE